MNTLQQIAWAILTPPKESSLHYSWNKIVYINVDDHVGKYVKHITFHFAVDTVTNCITVKKLRRVRRLLFWVFISIAVTFGCNSLPVSHIFQTYPLYFPNVSHIDCEDLCCFNRNSNLVSIFSQFTYGNRMLILLSHQFYYLKMSYSNVYQSWKCLLNDFLTQKISAWSEINRQ